MAKVRTLGPGSLKIGGTGSEHDFSADVTNTALEPSTGTARAAARPSLGR